MRKTTALTAVFMLTTLLAACGSNDGTNDGASVTGDSNTPGTSVPATDSSSPSADVAAAEAAAAAAQAQEQAERAAAEQAAAEQAAAERAAAEALAAAEAAEQQALDAAAQAAAAQAAAAAAAAAQAAAQAAALAQAEAEAEAAAALLARAEAEAAAADAAARAAEQAAADAAERAAAAEEEQRAAAEEAERVAAAEEAERAIAEQAAIIQRGADLYGAQCLTCHGDEVNGTTISGGVSRSIRLGRDTFSRNGSGPLAFVPYTVRFMPIPGTTRCLEECASDIHAYLLSLLDNGAPAPEPVTPSEPRQTVALPAGQTLLSRVTNAEFVNSAMSLLDIETNAQIESAKSLLGAESDVLGLFNDASTQGITQVAFSGYINMIDALVDTYFDGITTNPQLREFYDCEGTLVDCAEEIAPEIAERAFRRPLTDEEVENFTFLFNRVTVAYNEAGLNAERFSAESHLTRFRSAMYYILLSPDFLLLIEEGRNETDENGEQLLSAREIANRLSFFLTGNLPDDELLAAAANGSLIDPAVRAAHTDRLLDSELGEQQITGILRAWLGIKPNLDIGASDALDAFLLDWVANEKPFNDFYQAPVQVENIDNSVTSEPLGVFGLKSFIESHTEFPLPTFISRGVFVTERLLCAPLPEDVPDEALEAGTLEESEAFLVHSQDPCATCHRVFDNYGAAFQQFDSETNLFDPGRNIFGDSFDLFDIGDVTRSVSTVSDLSTEIGLSDTASACMAELWYRHASRRNLEDIDQQAIDQVVDDWVSSSDNLDVKSLLRAIATSDVFVTLYL